MALEVVRPLGEVVADLWARELRYARHCRGAVQAWRDGELERDLHMHVRQRALLQHLGVWWASLVPEGEDAMEEVPYKWAMSLLLERVLPEEVYSEVNQLVYYDFLADCEGYTVSKRRFFGAVAFLAVFFSQYTSLSPLEFTKLMHRNVFDAPDAVDADGGLLVLKRLEALRMRAARSIVDAASVPAGCPGEAAALYSHALDAHQALGGAAEEAASPARLPLSEQIRAVLRFVRGSGVRERQRDAACGGLLSAAAADAGPGASYYSFDLLLAAMLCDRGGAAPEAPEKLFAAAPRGAKALKGPRGQPRRKSANPNGRFVPSSVPEPGVPARRQPKLTLPGTESANFERFISWPVEDVDTRADSPELLSPVTSVGLGTPAFIKSTGKGKYSVGGSSRWSFPEAPFGARPATARAKLLQTVLHNRTTHRDAALPTPPPAAPAPPSAHRRRLARDPRLLSEGFHVFKHARRARMLEESASAAHADRSQHEHHYAAYRRWYDDGTARIHSYRRVKDYARTHR
eukprot:TRINITY_DN12213_c0_g1_i1.p1 TRINITY_DN12213_c0_g1~~TRINITY_DN12213_c0_g1_i1.p1  ORF type:complete len:518 (+),score=153.27 TRINITY_DN12213_c0_g1_i1:42-1595(+)